jgi:hypothetical protein
MSERVYALLLRLYPRAFRERYAQEMMRTFGDRLRHEPTFRLWIDVLKDAAVSIPYRHWVQDPHPMYPPSAAPLRPAYLNVRTVIAGALAGLISGVAVRMAEEPPGPWSAAGLVWIGLAVYLIALTFRKIYRAQRLVKACQADAGPDSVTVTIAGFAPRTLQRGEVVGLHLFTCRGLRIQAADPARDLWVPARTAAFTRVTEQLGGWAPTTVTPFLTVPAFLTMTRSFDNLLGVASLTWLALRPPVNIAGFVIGPEWVAVLTLITIVTTLRTRDLSVRRKLFAFAPAVILFVRWLW